MGREQLQPPSMTHKQGGGVFACACICVCCDAYWQEVVSSSMGSDRDGGDEIRTSDRRNGVNKRDGEPGGEIKQQPLPHQNEL